VRIGFRRLALIAKGLRGGTEQNKHSGKLSRESASLIVDIFGNCLHRARASEEYLSKYAVISLFWLFLLYETVLKQLFNSNNA
jgi:hypothetical protein